MALASQPLEPAAAPVPDPGPRVYGVIDVLRANRIAGWAIDRADSAAAVSIEIRREGAARGDGARRPAPPRPRARRRRDRALRLRLRARTRRCEPGFEFTVSATARTADGAACELRRAGAGDDEASAERRLMERIFALVSRVPDEAAERQDKLEAAIDRLELVQARIEAALAAVEPPPAPAVAGLRAIAGLAVAVALVSLGIGLVSMFQP